MTRTLFHGVKLLHLDPPRVETGDVLVSGATIEAVGSSLADTEAGRSVEHIVEGQGRYLMPGLVCGHHHLYSALACGMPLPANPPGSFTEMLQEVWWRLDVALDEESVIASGLAGGIGALKTGVTTIIDHHASPQFIEGSLEAMDHALDQVGLRRILCYEITDRNDGKAEAEAGLNAHRHFLQEGPTTHRAMLVGGHANFTMSDDTLARAGRLAKEHDVGLHIHVAEAIDDEKTTGEPLVSRMARLDALLEDSLFAHCVHLAPDELRRLGDAGVLCTHQARSNMNNAVGHARADHYPVGSLLGTDGIGADMISELQAAWFRGQEGGVPWAPSDFLKLLTNSAVYAGRRLGTKLGRLEAGYQADLVLLDAVPGPPLTTENLAAAMVFRFGAAQVRSVWVGGEVRLEDRAVCAVSEAKVDERAQAAALGLWARMRADRTGSAA